ncbi:MAG: hypothetical protein ABT940_11820, partial [Alphaproteobacteria bacterium]
AHHWIHLAARQGLPGAREALEKIAVHLSPDQLTESQHLTDAFKPTPASAAELMSPNTDTTRPRIASPQPPEKAVRAATPQEPAGTAENKPQRIRKLLEAAQLNIERSRLATPEGSNNAFEQYREILRLDPNNQQARAGLARVAAKYDELAHKERGNKGVANAFKEQAQRVRAELKRHASK